MTNNHINYVEFYARDLTSIQAFYENCFGWDFTSYGPDYIAFSNSGLQGGFERSADPSVKGCLVVLVHDNLEECKRKLVENVAQITVDIFSFPGGRRFQFLDPAGNELGVWCETK